MVDSDSEKSPQFFIAILKTLLSQFLGLEIRFLQLLQLQSYTINTFFISSFINLLDSKDVLQILELG